MFDELMRELRQLERGVTLKIDPVLDADGYWDRQCPYDQCRSEFKILYVDWQEKVKDECVYCVNCRHEAPAINWNTDEQEDYISQIGLQHLKGRIDHSIRRDAQKFNRRLSSRGLFTLRMEYRPSVAPIVLPVEIGKTLKMRYTCEECGCRYSSLGSAFFCPACGHNSATSTFRETLEFVKNSMNNLDDIYATLAASADEDTAKNSVRHLRENSLVRVASSLQRFSEALFDSVPNRQKYKTTNNTFQRLDESSKLWKKAVGIDYEDILGGKDYLALQVFMQQRHLLAHRDGIVDQKYLDRSGDQTYVIGQRIVISSENVTSFAEIVERLVEGLNRLMGK